MSPFLPEYSEQVNIPIFAGFNVLRLNSRGGYIRYCSGLMVCQKMDKLLINPNQRQHFEIEISNDLNDPHKKLVNESPKEILIPISIEV